MIYYNYHRYQNWPLPVNQFVHPGTNWIGIYDNTLNFHTTHTFISSPLQKDQKREEEEYNKYLFIYLFIVFFFLSFCLLFVVYFVGGLRYV